MLQTERDGASDARWSYKTAERVEERCWEQGAAEAQLRRAGQMQADNRSVINLFRSAASVCSVQIRILPVSQVQ